MKNKKFTSFLFTALKIFLLVALLTFESTFLLNYAPSKSFKKFVSEKVYSLSGFRFSDYRLSLSSVSLYKVRSSWFKAGLVKLSFSPVSLVASYISGKPLKINGVLIKKCRIFGLPELASSGKGIKISSFVLVVDDLIYFSSKAKLKVKKARFFYPNGSIFAEGSILSGDSPVGFVFRASPADTEKGGIRKFSAGLDAGKSFPVGKINAWGKILLEKGLLRYARVESDRGVFSAEISNLFFSKKNARGRSGNIEVKIYPFNLPGDTFRRFAGRAVLKGRLSVSPLRFRGKLDMVDLSYPGINFPANAEVSLKGNFLNILTGAFSFSSVKVNRLALFLNVSSLKGSAKFSGVLPGDLLFTAKDGVEISLKPPLLKGEIVAGGTRFRVSLSNTSWKVSSKEVRASDVSKVFAALVPGFSMTGKGSLLLKGAVFPVGTLDVSFRAGEFSNFPVTRLLSDYLKTLSLDPFVYNSLEIKAVLGGARIPLKASVFGWEAAVSIDGFIGKKTIDLVGILALSRELREELPLPVQALLSLQGGGVYFLPFRVLGDISSPRIKVGRLRWVNSSPAFRYGDISDYLQSFMNKVSFGKI